jgi:N6-adenosine-specific RNA methylase IME4
MSDDQILALPIGEIAAQHAYCLLWVTNNHLPLGFRCLEFWGFEYKSIFTWLKVTLDAANCDSAPDIMGATAPSIFSLALRASLNHSLA